MKGSLKFLKEKHFFVKVEIRDRNLLPKKKELAIQHVVTTPPSFENRIHLETKQKQVPVVLDKLFQWPHWQHWLLE